MAEKKESGLKYFGDEGHKDGFTRCSTGPDNDTKWKTVFYLPHPKDDAEAKERYNCDMGELLRKGLLQLGHGIPSKEIYGADGALNKDGFPTAKTIKAIQDAALKLQVGQSGPTKKELEAQKIREEAKASLFAQLGVANQEEFDAYAAKNAK